jgi:hypothetical protein
LDDADYDIQTIIASLKLPMPGGHRCVQKLTVRPLHFTAHFPTFNRARSAVQRNGNRLSRG